MNEPTRSPSQTSDGGTASAVAETASELGAEAGAQVKAVAQEASDHLRGLADRARSDVRQQAQARAGQAADGVRTLSSQLDALAAGDVDGAGPLAEYVRDASAARRDSPAGWTKAPTPCSTTSARSPAGDRSCSSASPASSASPPVGSCARGRVPQPMRFLGRAMAAPPCRRRSSPGRRLPRRRPSRPFPPARCGRDRRRRAGGPVDEAEARRTVARRALRSDDARARRAVPQGG